MVFDIGRFRRQDVILQISPLTPQPVRRGRMAVEAVTAVIFADALASLVSLYLTPRYQNGDFTASHPLSSCQVFTNAAREREKSCRLVPDEVNADYGYIITTVPPAPQMASSIAIVTGGGGDIGQAIALKLGATHDLVVLVDIDEAKTSVALDRLGREKFGMQICDITDGEQVAEMARLVLSKGAVRTLVNNAGGTRAFSLHDMTPEQWRDETSLNLDAAFLCLHAFQDSLKQTRGSVINIASVNGLSVFGNPAYSAAKAGLIHLTRSIAVEYGKFGIRANAVAPGTVRTAPWESRMKANPDVFRDVAQWYPLERIVEPQDVANAVSFLSSNEASAITGVCLPVDCGLTAGQTAIARTITQSDHY
ncbi:3-oxoacyl-acyl-carrier-protein reductase [Arthroderma uncinatum]|uniref:3-oxoacyl-acyl-carrier-protein reductase n=1 Tax=Arthroderma uncinatum TaxID=74035 RepID=UPI00144A8195|nr:3-oxoacyl-acyl-carrier-protein reductase [Arthroderma uncinatum]KAF3482038.1 3-oxoacyl-acyl-carrier-protein reductase [Arthroderma uncinatum]